MSHGEVHMKGDREMVNYQHYEITSCVIDSSPPATETTSLGKSVGNKIETEINVIGLDHRIRRLLEVVCERHTLQ